MDADEPMSVGEGREPEPAAEELADWDEQMQQEEVSADRGDSGRPMKKHKLYEGGAVGCSPAMEDLLAKTHAIIWAKEPKTVPLKSFYRFNEWKRSLMQQFVDA